MLERIIKTMPGLGYAVESNQTLKNVRIIEVIYIHIYVYLFFSNSACFSLSWT